MSHYSTIKTQIKSTKHLVTALCQMGVEKNHIKVDENGTTCRGFGNQERKAHIVVDKAARIAQFGEVGFERQADGTFTMHSDGIKRGFQDNLEAEYTRAVTLEQARMNGWMVQQNEWKNGELHVKLYQA